LPGPPGRAPGGPQRRPASMWPSASLPSFLSEQHDMYIQAWAGRGRSRLGACAGPRWRVSVLFSMLAGRVLPMRGNHANRRSRLARRLIERSIPVDAGELAESEQAAREPAQGEV